MSLKEQLFFQETQSLSILAPPVTILLIQPQPNTNTVQKKGKDVCTNRKGEETYNINTSRILEPNSLCHHFLHLFFVQSLCFTCFDHCKEGNLYIFIACRPLFIQPSWESYYYFDCIFYYILYLLIYGPKEISLIVPPCALYIWCDICFRG
jgi:hypothetical protein